MQKQPEMMVVRQPWDTGASAREDPYTELAITVVMTAVDDYIEIFKKFLIGDLKASEIRECELLKKELEQFFRSKEFKFYTAFLSTEIDPEAIIKLAPIRAKERLEEEIRKAEEKAKEAAEKAAKKAAAKATKKATKKAAKKATKKAANKTTKKTAKKAANKATAEQAEAKQDNTVNNNNSTADKAESEDAQ